MKFAKSCIAVFVFSVVFTGSVNAATVDASDVTLSGGGNVQTAIDQLGGEVSGLGSDVLSLYSKNASQDTAITNATNAANAATNVNDSQQNQISDLQNNKVDTSTFNLAQSAQVDKDTSQDLAIGDNVSRITALENAPKPTNGVDGKDGLNGKDGATGAQGLKGDKGDTGAAGKNGIDGKNGSNGVTTTITKVDTATQQKVANVDSRLTVAEIQAKAAADKQQSLENSVSLSQSSAKATNQRVEDLESKTNSRFASLKNEVDENKKESRSGAASAVAIASMPQVTDSQKFMISAGAGNFKTENAIAVGASFHAGEHTIVKAGVSASTNDDFAAGVGVGYGW